MLGGSSNPSFGGLPAAATCGNDTVHGAAGPHRARTTRTLRAERPDPSVCLGELMKRQLFDLLYAFPARLFGQLAQLKSDTHGPAGNAWRMNAAGMPDSERYLCDDYYGIGVTDGE